MLTMAGYWMRYFILKQFRDNNGQFWNNLFVLFISYLKAGNCSVSMAVHCRAGYNDYDAGLRIRIRMAPHYFGWEAGSGF